MKKAFALVLLLVAVAGCRPTGLLFVDPPGPPEYQLGWQDGCDSGMSASGDWRYKITYGFKKRPEMAANDQYKQGWNEGFTYCRYALEASDKPGGWDELGF